MKRYLKNIKAASFIAVLFLTVVSSLTSCDREPLTIVDTDNAFDLVIRPRWTELDERPTGFTAIIYTTDNSAAPRVVRSNNVDSVMVSLPAGGYRILVFNQTFDEYSTIAFRHTESYYDFEICAVDEEEKYQGIYNILPKSRLCKEPAIFAADCCNELYVHQADIDDARRQDCRLKKTLTMRPHIIISQLYIDLPVEGIYNGYAAQGCIDGMSSHVFPVYFEAGEKLGSYIVPQWDVKYNGVSSTDGHYRALIRNFGMPGTSLYLISGASLETTLVNQISRAASRSESDPQFKAEDIYLHMRVLLVDLKTTITKSYPVGDLIERRINDPLILDLVIPEKDKMVLPYVQPANGTGASGFDADVDGWDVKDVPVAF